MSEPYDTSTGEPLGADEIAAREPLWRIVHGEELPSETLAMLRTLRLSVIETILEGEPPPPPVDDA